MTISPENPWITLESETKYDNPWIRVVEHQVLTPKRTPGIYGTVHFKHLATGVIPIDADGNTYLVGQYRFALNAYSWEIPEGGGKANESALESAQRELREETGLSAARWLELVHLHLSNSVCDEAGICYVAWDLTAGQSCPEDVEQLVIKRLPFRELIAMLWRSEITDAMSVAAIQRLELMLRRGLAPADLALAVGSLD